MYFLFALTIHFCQIHHFLCVFSKISKCICKKKNFVNVCISFSSILYIFVQVFCCYGKKIFYNINQMFPFTGSLTSVDVLSMCVFVLVYGVVVWRWQSASIFWKFNHFNIKVYRNIFRLQISSQKLIHSYT